MEDPNRTRVCKSGWCAERRRPAHRRKRFGLLTIGVGRLPPLRRRRSSFAVEISSSSPLSAADSMISARRFSDSNFQTTNCKVIYVNLFLGIEEILGTIL